MTKPIFYNDLASQGKFFRLVILICNISERSDFAVGSLSIVHVPNILNLNKKNDKQVNNDLKTHLTS